MNETQKQDLALLCENVGGEFKEDGTDVACELDLCDTDTVNEGCQYYDELNDNTFTIEPDEEDGVVKVIDENSQWREHINSLNTKLRDGGWEPAGAAT